MLPWEAARAAQRKRAALGLVGLAVLALVVVGGMLLLLNKSSSDGKPAAIPPPGPSQATSTSSGASQAPSTRSASPSTASSKPAARSTSPASALTCTTKPACVLPGDPGGAVAAVNAYRTSHGRKAVPGSVTRAAQKCAVANGDTPACPRTYFWEPVSGHRGTDVVDKIAAKGDGATFLLDPRVKSIAVGWAYFPSSGGYECAIVNDY
jgi:hypothetical protein